MFNVYLNGKLHTTTNESKYTFRGLNPGRYEVKVENVTSGEEKTTFIEIPEKQETELPDETTAYRLDDFKKKAGWYVFPDGEKIRGREDAGEYFEVNKNNF